MTHRNPSSRGGDAPLTITRHPPEHGPLAAPEALPAGCCCCCCCCLHTIGGIVGAISGSVLNIPAQPVQMNDPDSPFPFRRDVFEDEGPVLPVTALYWLLVLFLCGVTSVWYYLSQGAANPENLMVGGLIALMILPALQLGASLLSLLAVAAFYPARTTPLKRVGKITLWSFAGTMVGVLLMAGCCGILSVSYR
jgi:hypothetical protein